MSRVFVRNISLKATESDIESLFSKAGKIEEIVLKTNFAFIQYATFKSSEEAIRLFNNTLVYGSKIYVELAKSRTEKLAERINEKCFKCGEMGHWAKDCKVSKIKKKEEKKKKYSRLRKSPRRSFSRSISSDSNRSRSRSRSIN